MPPVARMSFSYESVSALSIVTVFFFRSMDVTSYCRAYDSTNRPMKQGGKTHDSKAKGGTILNLQVGRSPQNDACRIGGEGLAELGPTFNSLEQIKNFKVKRMHLSIGA
jgi:hypothetical protein